MLTDTALADTPPKGDELDWSRPSTLDKISALRVLKTWFREDAQHSAKWRTEAKEDFDFLAGHQWSPDEKSQLKEQLRPEIVFNRSLTIIKAVAGFEINGRHEIQFIPRKLQDAAVNETLTGASKWMADECEAEDEESEAFQDCTTCGMGWCESRMDWEQDSQGLYIEEQISPIEMYWDRAARKRNLVDSQRRARLRTIPLSRAQQMFPGFSVTQLDARWASGMDPEEQTKTIEEKRKREENADDNYIERSDVNIVQMQWWELVPYWLVADTQTNKKIELSDDKYKLLTERMKTLGVGEMKAVKIFKREFFQSFIGGEILECGPAPQPDRFTFECITGQADKNKGTWFGLIRVMRDPQKWANKWLSQTLHIMNSNAKGGIMAEPDAFDDQRQAEESYARPESITWMKKGALSGSGPNGGPKWAQKPQVQFPAGFINLLEFAISSLRDVTGINLELLGQKDINQPGVLEAQRKQAGMTVLATMFDSLRRFRKRVGKVRLFYIQHFLSDGRLVRITGPEGAKTIPLIRDECLGEYDVVVDDAPTSPNQKQATWAAIAPLLPMFKEQLAQQPELLLAVLEYGPFPQRLIELLRTLSQKAAQDPTAQQMKSLNIAKIVAAIDKDQSTAEMQNAKAGATQATAMYDMAMAQNLLLKHQGDMAKAAIEWEKSRREADQSGLDSAHKLAQIDQTQAQTDNIRADTRSKHADTTHTHVQALVDALTPIQKPAPRTA